MNIGTVISSVGGSISNFSYGDITVFQIDLHADFCTCNVTSKNFASQAKYIYTDSSSLIEGYLFFLYGCFFSCAASVGLYNSILLSSVNNVIYVEILFSSLLMSEFTISIDFRL